MRRKWALLNILHKYKILVFIIILGAVGLLYYPILNAQYVWDDTLLFVNKTGLRESQLSWELIASPVLPGTSYFRPLIFFTWYWEFNLFGQNPLISHLIGLLVFAANAMLVYWIGLLLAEKNKHGNGVLLSLLATLIYITHPSLIESTAWVSGRFDQLCTFFFLVSIVFFLKNYKNSTQTLSNFTIIGISLCYLLALFSKELGLILPIVLFIFYCFLQPEISYKELIKNAFKYHKKLIFFLLLTTLFYFVLRVSSMEKMYHVPADQQYYIYFVLEKILPLYAIKYYYIQVFLPFSNVDILSPLNMIDDSFIGQLTAYFFGILTVVLLLISIVKRSLSSALFLCGFATLFLVLYFIPLGLSSNLGHSRFLTLPLAFFSLSIVFLPYQHYLSQLKLQKRLINFIFIMIYVSWISLSIMTVKSVLPFWMNEYTLWGWAYKNHPESALARYNYLYASTVYKQFDEIIDIAEKYKDKHGGLEVADQSVYANALLNKGDKESLNYYEGVISVLPKFHEVGTSKERSKVNSFNMTAAQIGDVYSSYGIGLLLMKNDIDSALKNIRIADWYMLPDQKTNVNYYSTIALYLSGKEQEALTIYQHQEKIDLKIGVENYKIVSGLIYSYCDKYQDENKQCSVFFKKNPFQ